MKYRELKQLLQTDRIASVRVVPIPLSKGWCIDVLIKEVLNVGSRTEVMETDRSSRQQPKVRRFSSIDSAARLLKQLDVTSFTVDMDDSISFFEAGAEPVPDNDSTEVIVAEHYRKAAGDQ
jgi:hypothetical protein